MKTEIQETDLQLVVRNKTLGNLTTNAIQIKSFVESILPNYDAVNYNESNIEQAKKDKATLNKAAKILNSKRLEIEKEFMKPFGEFKDVIAETVKLIGDCSNKIDVVVKQSEQKYKDQKLVIIKTYFKEKNENLVDFDKIFKTEWLNKTMSIKSVNDDIDAIFTSIKKDIETLKSFGDDFDILRTYYMDTLNINNTIQYANRLKEQRERTSVIENGRIEVEKECQSIDDVKAIIDSARFKLFTRAFKVTTSRENIIALGNFMNERGISFEKIEL